MMTVIGCITNEHDWRLVVVAAFVCLFGMTVTMQLLSRSVQAVGRQKLGWQFLAAVAGGGGVWTTHFVAMLAYRPSVPTSFDPALTALSLVLAMVGIFASLSVSSLKSSARMSPALGGAMMGLSFSAMHYTGMFAYRIVGLVEWDFGHVIASILLPVAFSALAVSLISRPNAGVSRFWSAVTLLVIGIVGLHFTAMAALRVTPATLAFPEIDAEAVLTLALAIASVALIIVGTGLTSYLIDTNVRADSRERLLHMASHDALTGLPNRRNFYDTLASMITAAKAQQGRIAVIAADLNGFKEINDAMGHSAGDEALCIIADRIGSGLTGGEFVARLGGDEFALIKAFGGDEEMAAFAARVSSMFRQQILIHGMNVSVAASVGAAIWPEDADDPSELVNNADLAMYHAKHESLDGVCFYHTSLGASVRRRRQLADALRQALDHDGLDVHYQVQRSLSTNEVHGYEALLRWTHPQLGPISPAEFIPVAEESGVIASLGAWALRRACADAAKWLRPYRVAVNVSAAQFMDGNLPDLVRETLVNSGLPSSRLELELTETAIIKDKVRSLHIMRQIKALGVGVALDDFGSGYSSLETLKSFPFDKIKLDRSFIDGIARDRQSKAIVSAVVALGKSLEISVLAEGIEAQEQVAILRAEGCDEGQGYLLGRPTPVGDLFQTQASSVLVAAKGSARATAA